MLTGLLAGCALPSLKDRSQSVAFVQAQTADTRLGSAVGREIETHPDLSGITTLEHPLDAFVARALLAEASERSLDVQYYIWRDDITGKLLLAHVASAQGIVATETIAGRDPVALVYEDLPRATYSQPQVASMGLTEAQARERGFDVKIGRFPFKESGKAVALGAEEGLVKIVADGAYGEVLGAHLLGHDATELLAEVSLTRMLEGTAADIGRTVHAHPSMSEALMEAGLGVFGESINI